MASALEKRSQANAKKVSNLIGVSSSAMTNLVINMSKKSQEPQTSVTPSTKVTKKSRVSIGKSSSTLTSKRQTSDEDITTSSMINATGNNHHKRQSNGMDTMNRSSSNETSGEHTPEATVVAPNLTNLLSLGKVGIDVHKQMDEDRSLLPNAQYPSSGASNVTNVKKPTRTGSSNKARKALRTITAIMGAFVLCWTPVSD